VSLLLVTIVAHTLQTELVVAMVVKSVCHAAMPSAAVPPPRRRIARRCERNGNERSRSDGGSQQWSRGGHGVFSASVDRAWKEPARAKHDRAGLSSRST
jgi:hypothetical protein